MALADDRLAVPGLGRRLAAFVYEGVLLFGVLMPAGWLYSTLTGQRHALQGRAGLQAVLFVVLALYFVWFWTHGGQTVAMKTWRLRLVSASGRPLTAGRALLRFVLCWLWFVPSLLAVSVAGLTGGLAVGTTVVAGILAYAGISWLHPDRQFLHDALCRTRLVNAAPAQNG
jgi:uncharacterized RDD family membrane protein YckC